MEGKDLIPYRWDAIVDFLDPAGYARRGVSCPGLPLGCGGNPNSTFKVSTTSAAARAREMA